MQPKVYATAPSSEGSAMAGVRLSARRKRVDGEIVCFAPGQFWVSVDRDKFAEVAEVSDDSWTATVVVTDATGHRLARKTVNLPQFREEWQVVPDEL